METALLYKRRRNGISLTALIDVVFILLMFFMLTTSFTREKQLELAAPVASKAATASSPQRVLVDSAGNLSLIGAMASLSDAQLKAELDSSKPVVLLPAPDAVVQTVVSAMTRLNRLGMAQLSLGKPYQPSSQTGDNRHAL